MHYVIANGEKLGGASVGDGGTGSDAFRYVLGERAVVLSLR